ncbi:pyrroline-5-carboxylate reductase [Endozoicomonas sp. OPT23]|uniref:pyrroline-5-carboxylate reductase n=1 Tax=Endozoicomonas sp. OPT23 TaxID=2072845 RepID=UPI00129B5A25|nr:pyrroline-5-carboxylate reductase [Endozoicomonas sp. OPT23]MRI31632.1 pyrroline-5-carboxylate reductase [Endozoicomonas sp. OPT23]
MSNKTIAFIGAGNMATSIFAGLIDNGWSKDKIWATARTAETTDRIQQEFGVRVTNDNHEAVKAADIVVLAVKPQVMKAVLTDLAPTLRETKPLLISVAAGITLESLGQWSDPSLPIVRSMPNTPSLLRCGVSGLYANSNVTDELKEISDNIFKAVGIAEWVEREELIDAVIAVAGSAPAYFFLFMEAITKTGVELGLSEETSSRMALQTALGAAKMAVESDVDAAELRRRVCSPNGTTEQAIKAFQNGGFEQLVDTAMRAAVKRAGEMAEELAD